MASFVEWMLNSRSPLIQFVELSRCAELFNARGG